MDKHLIMGNNDWLMRTSGDGELSTFISSRLRTNLIMAAIKKAYRFYADFLDISCSRVDFEKIVVDYEQDHSHAISLGLFQPGGIREKDHLNLWCLSHIFSPEVYVESGVFIGSSLHAFINLPETKKILAIDPNLNNLKIPKENIPGAELISDKDFSEIEIDLSEVRSLVFFDDHIDTADRIFQSFDKGARYILFDDSTGLEGTCQRLYPAIPTIPMIMNAEIFSPGDEISWDFNIPSNNKLKEVIKRLSRRKSSASGTRVTLVVNQEFIAKCIKAKKLIRKYAVLPDLGEFIPQQHPKKMIDTSKFIVELDRS